MKKVIRISNKVIGLNLLIATSLLLLTALTHPPSGEALLTKGGIAEVDYIWYLAHIVGVSVWIMFIFVFALIRRQLTALGQGILSRIGLIAMAFAGGSAFISGIFGGFVRPEIARMYLSVSSDKQELLHLIYEYNTMVNNMFANAYQVGFAVVIILFSIALMRAKVIGKVFALAGIIGGSFIAISFLCGLLSVQSSDFHVFIFVNLLCAGWTIMLGVMYLRR